MPLHESFEPAPDVPPQISLATRTVLSEHGDVIETDNYAMYAFDRCNGYVPIHKRRFQRVEREPIGKPLRF